MRHLFCILLLLITLSFFGCVNYQSLDEKYYPIKYISERPWYLSVITDEMFVTTIGDTVYVADINKWSKMRSLAQYDITLSHEKVHAYRQEEKGLYSWLWNYITCTEFRWHEEQLGWYVDLKLTQMYKLPIYPEVTAGILDNYQSMVSYDDALKWVRDVINGHWKPDKDEIPPDLNVLINKN